MAVLPYDAHRDSVVLVEQFRMGGLGISRGPWLMEIIAGGVEPGETPEDVAHRESLEEADCPLQELIPVCRYLASPGGSSEEVNLFCARAELDAIAGVHGKADEGEDIRVHVVPCDEALAMLENGTVHTAPAIIGLQWLALNRERLRELWA